MNDCYPYLRKEVKPPNRCYSFHTVQLSNDCENVHSLIYLVSKRTSDKKIVLKAV